MMNRFILIIMIILSASVSLASDDHDDEHGERTKLNAAISRGEILPLSEILARVQSRLKGRIVGIEFENYGSKAIYELYVLRKDGRRLEYKIDARTAKILNHEDED